MKTKKLTLLLFIVFTFFTVFQSVLADSDLNEKWVEHFASIVKAENFEKIWKLVKNDAFDYQCYQLVNDYDENQIECSKTTLNLDDMFVASIYFNKDGSLKKMSSICLHPYLEFDTTKERFEKASDLLLKTIEDIEETEITEDSRIQQYITKEDGYSVFSSSEAKYIVSYKYDGTLNYSHIALLYLK